MANEQQAANPFMGLKGPERHQHADGVIIRRCGSCMYRAGVTDGLRAAVAWLRRDPTDFDAHIDANDMKDAAKEAGYEL